MKTLDSHLHVWDPGLLHYDWLGDVPTLNRPFLPGQLAQNPDAPDAAIVVQADCSADEAFKEIDWINHLAKSSPPKILGIVAWAPLETGEGVLPWLQQLRKLPRVVGVRRSLQNEPRDLFYDTGYRTGLLAAVQANFTVDLCVRASQLDAVNDLLSWVYQRAPDARIVLDHMGKPGIAGHEWQTWADALVRLSVFPQLMCKISGLPTEADWLQWQTDDLRPWIDHAIACFGPQRCLFGGDWPVVELAGGYSRWRHCVNACLATLRPEQQQAVMAENARRFYLKDEGGEP